MVCCQNCNPAIVVVLKNAFHSLMNEGLYTRFKDYIYAEFILQNLKYVWKSFPVTENMAGSETPMTELLGMITTLKTTYQCR